MSATEEYWKVKFDLLKRNLEKNNFKVSIHDKIDLACDAVLEEIKDKNLNIKSIAVGGSKTLSDSRLYKEIEKLKDLKFLNPAGLKPEESIEVRRQSLLADYYLSSTNALTMDGRLVNLDMIGNRVGAIHFGPKHVGIVVGRNKLVNCIEEAKTRIQTYVAPMNSMRLKTETPCIKTGTCMDCERERRICNVWTITEKAYPAGRIHIFLVNEDLGM